MCVVKYKFTSKTGGFESYDSHQLLCGGMVEVNSGVYINAKFAINSHCSYKKNLAIKSLCIFYKPRI